MRVFLRVCRGAPHHLRSCLFEMDFCNIKNSVALSIQMMSSGNIFVCRLLSHPRRPLSDRIFFFSHSKAYFVTYTETVKCLRLTVCCVLLSNCPVAIYHTPGNDCVGTRSDCRKSSDQYLTGGKNARRGWGDSGNDRLQKPLSRYTSLYSNCGRNANSL